MADIEPPDSSDSGDDDLVDLPATGRRGRSPIMALVVIGLAGVLSWHLRADLIYAFAARTPTDLGDARSLGSHGAELTDNRHVTISGQAERRYALYLEPRGDKDRATLFRLLGGGTRLFVRATDTLDRTDVSERWSGRLRRFDALPYHQQLRKYYREQTQVTRYLSLDSLKAQLSGGPSGLTDRGGTPMTVAPDDRLVIDVDYPGELKVYLSMDKFPSLADAEHELDRLGLAPSPGEKLKDEFVFVVPLPDAKKNEIIGKLSARDFAFVPREERVTSTRADLALVGDTLKVGPKNVVPFARVKEIGVPTPVDIDHDAFILVEGEAPGDFLWVPLLVALLITFAAFNVWYLLRTRRRTET